MLTDLQLLILSLVLSGMICGSIFGFSMYCGDNQERQSMSQLMKVVLVVFFPFTLAAIGSAKAVMWWLEWIDFEIVD